MGSTLTGHKVYLVNKEESGKEMTAEPGTYLASFGNGEFKKVRAGDNPEPLAEDQQEVIVNADDKVLVQGTNNVMTVQDALIEKHKEKPDATVPAQANNKDISWDSECHPLARQ